MGDGFATMTRKLLPFSIDAPCAEDEAGKETVVGVEEGDAPCAESEEAGLRGEGGEEGGAEEGPPRVHQEWDVTLSVVAAVCTIEWDVLRGAQVVVRFRENPLVC